MPSLANISFFKTVCFALLCILYCPIVSAFSEDICYAYQSKNLIDENTRVYPLPFNCNDLQCTDGLDGNEQGASCTLTGFGTLVLADMLYKLHGRNSLHFDVVWLLARAMGLTIEDSNKLAAFSEATDLGQYWHYDYTGKRIETFNYESIDGVGRMNQETNGFWFHYVPWFATDSTTHHSLDYNFAHAPETSPFNSWETALNHLRAWAFAQRDTLCSFGLTANDGSCYTDTNPATLTFSVPIVNPYTLQDTVKLGRQMIKPCSNGDPLCYEANYDQSIKGAIEALGIYLHAMDDRLSHFQCSDYSAIRKTSTGADHYTLNYALTCGQVLHFAMHYRETGHPHPPARTRNAVIYTLHEIDSWIKTTGYSRSADYVNNETDQNRLTQRIINEALPQSCAADRLHNLCKIAHDYGLGWHDNNPNCQYHGLNCSK